ncbi:DNA-binding transcriptional regulator, LysR family [Syntrophus gentianae]|uniref:DNA-binding transcriptional regulator, LysR family n=1 Tax=Syntrophus gentianae TaxID=43775 RepID=A0A1H7VLH4_9BACT|nr:LysR substrate-binding domain-containing protein [Syntrophus gentianae]SEM10083.1 DNA-binding transcriptional regulator, LysR family [Syntrophus gentianae]
MELRHIRYFVAAAEELNISRASRRLNVSQPAMSHLIHDLEEELEAVLFVRERFGIRLTAAGEKFLVYAHQIIDLHNEAVRVVGNIPVSGNILNIGFVALPIISCLGAALRRFRESNPRMSVKIHELSPADQVRALRKKQIDVALFDNHGGVALDEFEKTALFEIHLIAVIPETHYLAGQKQISMKDLAKDEFIGYREDSYPKRNQAIISACLAAGGFKPDMHYHAASVVEVLAMIGSGAGVSLLPNDGSGISHPGVTLIAIKERLEPILFTAAWRRNYNRLIIDQLLGHIKLQTSE